MEHHRKLERMYRGAPINAFYAPTVAIGDGEATIAIDVRQDFFHALGAVHGSVYFKLLDDAAFFAASSLVEDVFLLTSSYTTYFTRPVTGGRMIARGRVVHRGGTQLIADAAVEDGAGREVGRGTGLFVRSRHALTPEVGYR